MLRGSSSLLTSLSVSSSHSSLHGDTAEDRDDIESYLSAFKRDRRKQSKIDWTKLLESRGEGGNDVNLTGANAGETTFLKPKSSAGREPTASSIGLRHSKEESSTQQRGSHFRSKHAMVLVEDELDASSSVSSSTSSKPSEGQQLKQQQYDGSNDSDSDGNPLTNVKLAIPVDFSLSEEESHLVSSHSSRKWLSGKATSPTASGQYRKTTSENKHGSLGLADGAEGSTDTDISMSLHLQRNVFSIEQLEAEISTHSEPEPDASDSDTESAPAVNLKNVRSLNELELVGDNADTNCKDRDMDLSSSMKAAITSSQVVEEGKAFPEPENTDGGRKSHGFRFSAARDNIPLANTREMIEPKLESPSRIFSDQKCSIEDHSDGHSYSDDDFESDSWNGEEEIVEELSGEEHSLQAVDDVRESSGGAVQSHPDLLTTDGSGITSQKTTQSQGHISPHVEKQEPSEESDDTGTEKELTYTSFTEEGPKTSEVHTADEQSTPPPLPPSPPRDSHGVTPSHSATESTLEEQHSAVGHTPQGQLQDAAVQTSPLTACPTVSPRYGGEFPPVDPSPILPHVVGAEALEVVTAYSPSTIALNDMLRAQLVLTRQFIANTRQIAETLSNSITADHHYTTLEETKDYIARHKPKVLSLEEAKQLSSSKSSNCYN